MKKIILCGMALAISMGAMAQQKLNRNGELKAFGRSGVVNQSSVQENSISSGPSQATTLPLKRNAGHGTPSLMAITVDSVGSSSTGFSNAYFGRTALFAHPVINSAIMVYRNNATLLGGNSGNIKYGLSTDGGNTWTKDQGPIYTTTAASLGAPFGGGRLPQAGIYNPSGNTVPSNAFLHFFAPSIAGVGNNTGCQGFSSGNPDTIWGGFTHGAMPLSGGAAVKSEERSTSFVNPDDFVLNQGDNSFWTVANSKDIGTICDFTDSIIIGKGAWTGTEYAYTYTRIAAPQALDSDGAKLLWNTRIAFAPNGQIGYITVLGHESFVDKPDSVFYPVVFKTSDAGVTWARVAAIDLQNLDATLTDGGGSRPISIAFDHDISVDANGNLHIIVLAHYISATGLQYTYGSLTDGTLSLNGTNAFSYFDIYTTNGGSSWSAQELADPTARPQVALMRYHSDVAIGGGFSANVVFEEYGRPAISRSLDGTRILFTWCETDTLINNTGNNDTPNAKMVGYNTTTGLWTNVIDATSGSDADALMNMVSVSPLALDGASAGCYKIPMTYSILTNSVPTNLASGQRFYFFLNGAEICDGDYTVTGTPVALDNLVSVKEIKGNSSIAIGQNYPNPFRGETRFDINLKQTSNITIDVVNVLGKLVKSLTYNNVSAGVTTLSIDGSDLAAGMYTYTVKIGTEKVSRNMMVK